MHVMEMEIRSIGSILLAALALGLLAASPAAAAEIVGATEATMEWTPAAGPVSGYYVVVSRDGGDPTVLGVTQEPRTTISGAYGETLVLQVAAFGDSGLAGPLSESSSPITFSRYASDGSGGGSGGGSGDDSGSGGGGAGEPVPGAVPRDFTGDGFSDLIVRDGSALSLWAMGGSGVAASLPLPPAPEGFVAVGAGDYDGNGSADLLWREAETGTLLLWLVEAGSVVTTGTLDRAGLEANGDWRVGGSGDFDADGRDDVLLFSRVLGVAEIWYLEGTTLAGYQRLEGRTGAWSVAAVADVDGDNRAEIVWRDELREALELADPDAGSLVSVSDGLQGWRIIGAADYDGDGRETLLLQDVSRGALEAWSLGTEGLSSVAAVGEGALAPWSVRGGGDFDGNGLEDVLWVDDESGGMFLWLSSGTGVVEQPLDASLPADGVLLEAHASADRSFRERFCDADLDDDGVVSGSDFTILLACFEGPTGAPGCDPADFDGDGTVTSRDAAVFVLRFRGEACVF